MKLLRVNPVTSNYALKAALYRRCAKRQMPDMDFSRDALIEMFLFESKGGNGLAFSELKSRNGYAYGKWLRDLDVAQMCKDVTSGDFCKAEFMETALQRVHNAKPLSRVLSGYFFPWQSWGATNERA